MPFLRDKKNYLSFIVQVIKNNIKDEQIVESSLQVMQMLLCETETVEFISKAYPSI